MRITVNKDSDIPIYVQIKNQIRDMIYSGVLQKGFLLPPERKLSEELEINRSTVFRAYQELKADGLIGSHVGKGTQVIKQFASSTEREKKVYPILWNQFFNKNAVSANENIIGDILESQGREDLISFAGGMPSPDFYPVEEIMKIQADMYNNHGIDMLSHSPVEGYFPLRENISRMLKDRGIMVSPKEVMILSGSQQGLDIASRIFLNPGDIVFVEEPTYLGAVQLFKGSGARIMGIPMDSDGMRIDILESMLERYKPKLIYTLPTFQNPSGIVMSLERRYKLLSLIYSHQIPLIEDDPYGELRYDGNFTPSLKSLDKHGYVIYLSTFSKTLFMGFRIGWLAAPQQVINKFSEVKQITDLHANTPVQHILSEFLRRGFYHDHINRVSAGYSLRRNMMYQELEKYKTLGLSYEKPEGGYYMWCKLPDKVNSSLLMTNALSLGVSYIPGEAFFPDGWQANKYIRLNFTHTNESQIKEGVKRLMKALEESLSSNWSFSASNIYSKEPIV